MRRQHGVVTRSQLLALGLSSDAITHRLSTARLHPVARGVYAVGRPELSQRGQWLAHVLSCGSTAVLSHHSAAELWAIRSAATGPTHVTVSTSIRRRRPGVVVHCRSLEAAERTLLDGILTTTVQRTLLDIATTLRGGRLEAAINEADKLDLVDPESLREALDRYSGRPGVAALRAILDRGSFRLTDSDLERRFLRIVERAGLPLPATGEQVNGFKVDFQWPELGLVVETDGLRYHRTPVQQARDRLRDQAHAAAGLTTLRFTHAQVRYEPTHVRSTLMTVATRLRKAPHGPSEELLA